MTQQQRGAAPLNGLDTPTVTWVNNQLASYAPLNSPTFGGTPTVPTPASGDNSQIVPNTAWVTSAISSATGATGGPYAPLASPAFTGTPTAPTAAAGNASTQLATTQFFWTNLSNWAAGTPTFSADARGVTQSAGDSSTLLATDAFVGTAISNALASYAPLASPALTGTPTAPTASGTTSSTQIATMAAVQAALVAYSGDVNQLGGITSDTAQYVRLARLSSVNSSSGANLEALLSGTGNYGSAYRGDILISIAQRGAGQAGVTAKATWLTAPGGGSPALYFQVVSDYVIDVWAFLPNYQSSYAMAVLSSMRTTAYMDSATASAPSGLVAFTSLLYLEQSLIDVDTDASNNGRLGSLSRYISGGDWNNYRGSGFYRGQSMSNNFGGDSGWNWIIEQSHDATSWQSQIAIGYTGNSTGLMGYRYQNNGSWQSWNTLATQAWVSSQLASYAPLASPGLTGAPTAPTAATGNNSTQIATTAFVQTAAANAAAAASIAWSQLPFKAASGVSTSTVTPGGTQTITAGSPGTLAPYQGSTTITFPSGRFSTAPFVACTAESSAQLLHGTTVARPSTTGFTVYYQRSNTTAAAIEWVALAA